MKLLTKTGLYYLLLSLVLFFVGGLVFYYQLKNIIDEDFTENMFIKKEEILKSIKDTSSIPIDKFSFGDKISFTKTDNPGKEFLKDTMLYNEFEEENQPFRQLTFSMKLKDGNYTVTISKPMFESGDLVETILTVLIIISCSMLALLFLLTRYLSKKIWRPFFNTMELMRNFEIGSNKPVSFLKSNTVEFQLLNSEIEGMINKIQEDYQNLKEFTENASHEIQTPLAIIRSKLELIIEMNNLTESQVKPIQDAYEATNRLSKLNQSLLLLTKIENRQFNETHLIDLKNLIDKKIGQLEEMVEFKKISITQKSTPGIKISMNLQLADILVSNLFNNAIRHNVSGGNIEIEITPEKLVISNTGLPISVDPSDLFERFRKSSDSHESTGLGLSIVKQICTVSNFKVTYTTFDSRHIISIFFS